MPTEPQKMLVKAILLTLALTIPVYWLGRAIGYMRWVQIRHEEATERLARGGKRYAK